MDQPKSDARRQEGAPEPDSLLGGRVKICQPEKGFRTPVDSLILAAGLKVAPGEEVLDVGCGIGTVGLCLAMCCRGIRVSGIDIDERCLELAAHNAVLNDVRAEFRQGNILVPGGPFSDRQFDAVLSNPPFFSPDSHRSSPDQARRRAMQLTDDEFSGWVSFCLRRVRSGGQIALMVPPARLMPVLSVFEGKAGSIVLFPVWSKAGQPAKRLLIRARKGGRGALVVPPGLVMHAPNGAFTSQALSVLQGGARLADIAGDAS